MVQTPHVPQCRYINQFWMGRYRPHARKLETRWYTEKPVLAQWICKDIQYDVPNLCERYWVYQSTYAQSGQLKFREWGNTNGLLGLKFRIRLVTQKGAWFISECRRRMAGGGHWNWGKGPFGPVSSCICEILLTKFCEEPIGDGCERGYSWTNNAK